MFMLSQRSARCKSDRRDQRGDRDPSDSGWDDRILTRMHGSDLKQGNGENADFFLHPRRA